ncbi:MAG: GMC family oxidoreductase [Mariprofundaceae bacterium]|nr:GMC family oxidoreductase [Mariprofundaceae bacterium]
MKRHEGRHPHVDCVVIGSGIAGALVAKILSKSGLNVHILEAGGIIERQQAVAQYKNAWDRNLSSPFPIWPKADYPRDEAPERYYGKLKSPAYAPSFLKGVGGTTWHWTGIAPRFLPSDFVLQSKYGVGVDWPITYREIEPYYVKAERALGVSGNSLNDHGSPRSAAYPMPAIPLPYSDQLVAERLSKHGIEVDALPAARNSRHYAGRPACCGYGTCTPICPIGASYSADVDIKRAQRYGAKLTENAVVYRFDLNDRSEISRAYFKRPDGSSHHISADYFVIACNSIETPRLMLLAAQERCADGLGNRSGMVGRNLMDHVLFACNYQLDTPLYMGRGPVSVSTLLTGRNGDFRQRYAAAKLFLGNDRNVAKEAIALLGDATNWSEIEQRIRHKLTHKGMIGGEIEQLPIPSNRLTLDTSRLDKHGLPLPDIQLSLNDYTQKAVEHWQAFTHDLIRKIGGVATDASINISSHHPCGTTCMGTHHKTSVVDAQCKTHDHDNLYIAGSSVFPTIGTANPTLTIAALALRMAEHLIKRIN